MSEEWRITVAVSDAGAGETLRALFPEFRFSGGGASPMAYADSKERAEEMAAAIRGAVPSEVALTWWDAVEKDWRPIDEYGTPPDPEREPEPERQGGLLDAIIDGLGKGGGF